MSSLIVPIQYQVYVCKETARWFVFDTKAFYNGTSQPMNLNHVEHEFGLTEQQVVIEFFRINGGKPGYYLANLRSRKYYYCGPEWSDIKITLRSLGIGRDDPFDTATA